MVKRPKEREKQTENQKDIVDKKSKNKLKKRRRDQKGVSKAARYRGFYLREGSKGVREASLL